MFTSISTAPITYAATVLTGFQRRPAARFSGCLGRRQCHRSWVRHRASARHRSSKRRLAWSWGKLGAMSLKPRSIGIWRAGRRKRDGGTTGSSPRACRKKNNDGIQFLHHKGTMCLEKWCILPEKGLAPSTCSCAFSSAPTPASIRERRRFISSIFCSSRAAISMSRASFSAAAASSRAATSLRFCFRAWCKDGTSRERDDPVYAVLFYRLKLSNT